MGKWVDHVCNGIILFSLVLADVVREERAKKKKKD